MNNFEEKVIELFNKYDPLLLHIGDRILPVRNTSKQDCYDLVYEIGELFEWRRLLFKKYHGSIDIDKEFIANFKRPQGHWVKDDVWRNGEYIGGYWHINCPCVDGYPSKVKYNFCPNCGAKMKGADDE